MSQLRNQHTTSESKARVAVQRFGRFLSGMVMPNIGAFIAWGFITAMFIPTGWIPNESLASLVRPMMTYLLPLLIGYTGGHMIHGTRGGVIGAVATMGAIVGAEIPMLLGAMIMGPLSAWILKKFDQAIDGKVRAGFEMLVNNFSSGIIGFLLALASFKGVGPVVQTVSRALADGVEFLINNNLIPLANILIEPGKVLFLNNAINHGVLGPIALDQAAKTGQSLIFMLESNPGPGLGILLAYWLFGRGMAKQSSPGAIIIHFLGGIHEIYFPYILMKPVLILAAIGGGIAGTFTFSLLGAGLVATPSPGSIFAYLAMTPKGGLIPVLSGVFVAAIVSFLIASVLLKTSRSGQEDDLESATAKMKEMKAKSKGEDVAPAANTVKSAEEVNKIVFACDAGMGSSAMGASILRRKMNKANIKVTVTNTAINDIPADADIVITHNSLTDRAKLKAPNAEHISIDDFLKSAEYDELVQRLSKS
ncbi:subunit EIIBC of PTS mannitol transporter [Paenibacillus sp. 32O-W]|uniref:PTS mannitol transporter subunit IICB n=1 Tax=Paenibacillus sp. 32O-W TaxID=1695218 RepID=UPI0007206C28|nr:PTS mannitol transporter subunit IICB [Paenibacillus sp. 32O-W]ALS25869.1 subunit EIIBC of PTS mannitol transporter [Paenibacillus sp. 32O-W]